MNEQHIEPIILPYISTFWHVHLYPIASQLVVHPGILDIPDTIHCEVTITLFQKDGTNLDSLVRVVVIGVIGCEVQLAKVVDHA